MLSPVISSGKKKLSIANFNIYNFHTLLLVFTVWNNIMYFALFTCLCRYSSKEVQPLPYWNEVQRL
jgi:hypothetical protein